MKPFRHQYFCFLQITVFILGLSMGCGNAPEQTTVPERINIAQALSADNNADCYEIAKKNVQIAFPKDAGPHNGFRTEWWYYTGNVFTDQGRHFGYQLTFFRQALSCEPLQGSSKWRTRQLYFAHFAVTDSQDNRFLSDVRMNRESLGIAGAKSLPYRVWIDDWQVQQEGDTHLLTAKSKSFSIEFELYPDKPVVFQSENGFSQKGKKPSNASHYYSFPRLTTNGTIKIDQTRYLVTGKSWLDHEWSTSALDSDVAGWDWFSVHFEDGRDLMICQVRTADGYPNGQGFGSISFPDGTYKILKENQFKIQVTDYWKSPETGKQYPSKWQISIPDQKMELLVTPTIPGQEHTHMFAYWEGAARFIGKNARGTGYVEMTGY